MGNNIFQKEKEEFVKENDEEHYDESYLEIFVEDCGSSTNQTKEPSVAEKLSQNDPNIKHLISKWDEEQLELKKLSILCEYNGFIKTVKYIGGLDISFPSNKSDLVHACACLVVISYPDLEIIYKSLKMVHLTSVYIPHYLAFREVGPFKELVDELKLKQPEYYPQILLLDGNGILHSKKFGIACHLGVELGLTTIGVAKKLFHVDGLEKSNDFKSKLKTLKYKGDNLDLNGLSGDVYGKVLKSTENSTNPIYVSVGHKISLDSAMEIVNKCCKVRVPEPIRWADILSREYLREHYEDHYKSCSSYSELNDYFLKLSSYY